MILLNHQKLVIATEMIVSNDSNNLKNSLQNMSSLQHSTETWFVGSYKTRVDITNTTFEGIVSKFLIEQLTTVR